MAGDETLSYGELADRARDRAPEMPPLLAVAAPASIEFAVLLHAAAAAGTALAPLNPQLEAPPLPPEIPDGTLAVLFTSGTTGGPRPVALTRPNFEASARASAAMTGLAPADRWLCCVPVFHVAGLSILTRTGLAGASTVLEPAFDPARVRALLEAGEATVVSLVPTMLSRLRDAGFEGAPALRAILLGGGPIPDELCEWAVAVGLPVMPTYGMTETCSQVATASAGERLTRPLPGAEIRIAADGEIQVRGAMVAPTADRDPEGWLRTGDRGELTEDGLLRVHGRMDDLIVTGGENVAAAEVEAVLRTHPAVRDAAVIGVDDPEWGRAVTAFVAADASEAELLEHARGLLPGFKVPKRVVLLDELPRTASGKVMRASLESRADDLRQGR